MGLAELQITSLWLGGITGFLIGVILSASIINIELKKTRKKDGGH